MKTAREDKVINCKKYIVSKQDAQKKALETSESKREWSRKIIRFTKRNSSRNLNAKDLEFMLRVQKQKAKSKEHQKKLKKY